MKEVRHGSALCTRRFCYSRKEGTRQACFVAIPVATKNALVDISVANAEHYPNAYF